MAFMALLLMAQGTDPLTWPGPDEGDDAATDIDPTTVPEAPTLGEDVGSSTEDSALYNSSNGSTIIPIGLTSSNALLSSSHYFTYNRGRSLLVGVSADNACHFNVTGTGQCSYANYQTYINDMAAQGLNVMRLWVSIVGGSGNTGTCHANLGSETDNPFAYDGTVPGAGGLGRYYLDVRYDDYFTRLYNVVSYANSKNVIVEVTLFSPLTGILGIGPWSPGHAFLSSGTPLPGFTDTKSFTDAGSAQYLAMQPYVFNVVHWTVDKLWSLPNVYFEVANEPENIQPTSTNPCGWGTTSQSDPATVAAWQKAVSTELQNYEQKTYVNTRRLAVRHLVAVEPSTIISGDTFVGVNTSAGSVINSHYTTLLPKSTTSPNISLSGLGAIRMIRRYYNKAKIFGFNESKITGGAGCVSTNTGGSVDAGRAEAWEFMVDQGASYDQFGYSCNAADYAETRRQMGVLRRFLTNSQVAISGLRASSPSSPSWVNPGPYGAQEGQHQKYWAAVEPVSALSKHWLLYVHHSGDRRLVNDGYQAVITSGGYQEHLSVCLGSAGGTYRVQWFAQPKNAASPAGALTPTRTDMLSWPGASSCTPGGSGSIALQASPAYDYDLALLITP